MKKILSLFTVYLLMCATVGCGGAAPTPEVLEPEVAVGGEIPPENIEQVPEEDDTVPRLSSPPAGDERIVGITAGSTAPFSGVLLNDSAAAWLESEGDAVQERCQLFVSRRTGELRARLLAESERLQLRITTLTQIHTIELNARDQRILSLEEMNEDLRNRSGEWWEQVLMVGGALIIGIAVGIIGAIVAN